MNFSTDVILNTSVYKFRKYDKFMIKKNFYYKNLESSIIIEYYIFISNKKGMNKMILYYLNIFLIHYNY